MLITGFSRKQEPLFRILEYSITLWYNFIAHNCGLVIFHRTWPGYPAWLAKYQASAGRVKALETFTRPSSSILFRHEQHDAHLSGHGPGRSSSRRGIVIRMLSENKEARDLFLAVLALTSAEEQNRYLDQVCRDKPELIAPRPADSLHSANDPSVRP